jgi:hypothetical protein
MINLPSSLPRFSYFLCGFGNRDKIIRRDDAAKISLYADCSYRHTKYTVRHEVLSSIFAVFSLLQWLRELTQYSITMFLGPLHRTHNFLAVPGGFFFSVSVLLIKMFFSSPKRNRKRIFVLLRAQKNPKNEDAHLVNVSPWNPRLERCSWARYLCINDSIVSHCEELGWHGWSFLRWNHAIDHPH